MMRKGLSSVAARAPATSTVAAPAWRKSRRERESEPSMVVPRGREGAATVIASARASGERGATAVRDVVAVSHYTSPWSSSAYSRPGIAAMPQPWNRPEREATPASSRPTRRRWLKAVGAGGAAAAAAGGGLWWWFRGGKDSEVLAAGRFDPP